MNDSVCGLCRHRIVRDICGCQQSSHYEEKIDSAKDTCGHFSLSEAAHRVGEGLGQFAKALTAEEHNIQMYHMSAASKEFESALKIGLLEDDEIVCRAWLGNTYFVLSNNDDERLIEQGITQIEKALALDAQGNYGYFSSVDSRARDLERFQVACNRKASAIYEKNGVDAAIKYLENKLQLFRYLPGIHMVVLHFTLGAFYETAGKVDLARKCYQQTLEAEVLNLHDDFEQNFRLAAEQTVAIDQQKPEEVKKSKCFIATAVYGSAYAPEVEIFRQFRDESLLSYSIGRKLVSFYYLFSPYVATLINKSRFAKSVIKAVILRPTNWLIKIIRGGRIKWQR